MTTPSERPLPRPDGLERLERALRLDAVEDYDGNIFALTEWGYQTIPRRNALRGLQEPQEGASDG